MLFTYTIGWVVDHFSYTPVLIAAASLGPMATISLFLLSETIRFSYQHRPSTHRHKPLEQKNGTRAVRG